MEITKFFLIVLSTMMEIFCICSIQYGSHQPHVTIKHLKYDYVTNKIIFLFYLTLIKFKQPLVASDDHIKQHTLDNNNMTDGQSKSKLNIRKSLFTQKENGHFEGNYSC